MFIKNLFKKLYKYWMKFAYVLGWINSRIIFTVLYILLVGIYAIIGWFINLLKRKETIANDSYWLAKEYEEPTKEIMKRQF